MSPSPQSRRDWPPVWMVALVALGLFWLALGLSQRLPVPFILAGLCVVAGYGLVRGGLVGRAVAALVALASAAPVIAVTLILGVWVVTDPHGTSPTDLTVGGVPGWIAIVVVVAIVAGYGSVVVRAIRGR
jgi:hypothetical protein